MPNNKLLPTSFSKKNAIKDKINSLNDITKRKLARFPYRYRFAKSFNQIDADTAIKTRTLIGYEAGMKIFLAYTCYEQIVYVANYLKIDGVNAKAFNEVINNEITTKLHKNKSFMNMIVEAYEMGITEEIESEKNRNATILSNSLDKFINNKSADVLCLAYAIRNLYAHGEFTGGGAGVTNNTTRNLLYEIAEEVLSYSNKIYTQCLEKINTKK
jgi:hypothetical protein